MLKKITESDINGLGVVGLADTPGLSATDMQEKFEEISKSAIIPKFNQLIDDLEALNIYHKVDSVEGKGLSTNDYTNEDKEALYSTKGKIDETVKIFGKASIDFGRKPDTVKGDKSTALGADNTASGNYSDAFGNGNVSSGLASHSEGANNISSGKYSHAEGNENEATKDYSHAEGYKTKATSLASHSEGQITNASGTCSHAEGYLTKAFDFSHSEGDSTTASGIGSHAEGSETEASGLNSHSEGKLSVASGQHSHAEGNTTKAIANNSHAEGIFTKVDLGGENGHAEGYGSIVTGESSHAEGINTKAEGNHSHAEGNNTTAKGSGSHAEGAGTIAQGENSHAEGSNTTSSGSSSHAEGASSQASGSYSHAEGAGTVASGDYSHAEGSGTRAKGSNAHAEGGATIATGEFQHVQGKFNVEDTDGAYAHIVGGGSSDTDRKNIHTLDWQGNAEFAGNVTDGYGNSMSLLKTESGHSLELSIDENYIMTISLLNKSGETISSKAIDFPIESMVVNASYSSGKLTLVLQNGNMVDVDVSSIVKGLVNESRTIAGIDLKDDITADELIAALGIDTIKEDVAQLKGDIVELQTYFINEKEIDLSSASVGFVYDGNGWYGITENPAYKNIHLTDIAGYDSFTFSSSVFQGVNTVLIHDANGNTLYNSGLITENYKEYKNVTINIPENATGIYFNYLVYEGRTGSCSLVNKHYFYDLVDEEIEKSTGNKNIIDCWGDSLTMGAGGNGTTYPNVLQNLLGENYVVNNYGVGGENALTIGGRQGGYEWYVEPFNIPSDTTPIEVKLKSLYEDRTVNPLLQGSVGVNPCTIKGVEGSLSLSGGKYYFTRLKSGDSVTVSREEPIRTNAFNNHNHTLIIFIGQNGWGFADDSGVNNIYGYDRLADIIDNMVNHNKSKNYIVLGLHTLNKETRKEMEEYFTRKFGNHYINLRKYLTTPIYENGIITSCYGLEDVNITPTEEDLSNIENGVVPNSLLSDGLHFNASGYTVIGNLIYRIGKSLDYWR